MSKNKSVEDIALTLNGKRQGGGWIACCPAHPDKTPSLSINQSENGKVLVKCHAGCSQKAVVDSLKELQLWSKESFARKKLKETNYTYGNRGSTPVLQIKRTDYDDGEKDIYQFKIQNGKVTPGKPKEDISPYLFEKWKNNDDLVIFVEGEKCVDALHSIGLNATTTPGGSNAWHSNYAPYFDGRDVIVIPDNDEVGREYAQKAINDLLKYAKSIKYLELRHLKAKEDIFDWLESGHTKDQLLEHIEKAPYVDDGWPLLVPLDYQPLAKLHSSVLPEPLCAFVQAVSIHTETPIELATVMALGTLSLAGARSFRLEVKEGYSEPLNLYILAALESGNRKSPVFNICHKPLYDWQKKMANEAASEIKENEIERKNIEAEIKKLRNRLGGKGENGAAKQKLIDSIRALEFSIPASIFPPRLLASDITPEEIGTLLQQNNEIAGIFSDEGGIFELLGGRYSNGVANIELALKAYSGTPHAVDRRTSLPINLENPLLVFCLSPQPAVLNNLIQDPVFRSRGLVARFLFMMPDSPLGSRTGQTISISSQITQSYNEFIIKILNIDRGYDLRLSNEAYNVWHEYWIATEKEMADDGRLEFLRDWAAKLPGNVARLAGLLHLASNATRIDQIGDNLIVQAESVLRAITLGDFLKAHAIKVFQSNSLDPAQRLARAIADWISDREQNSFSRRDCHHRFQKRISSAKNLLPSLRLLEDRGYIRSIEQKMSPSGGRPSEIWEVNPQFLRQSKKEL
jgi:putative DNA primase/helicase